VAPPPPTGGGSGARKNFKGMSAIVVHENRMYSYILDNADRLGSKKHRPAADAFATAAPIYWNKGCLRVGKVGKHQDDGSRRRGSFASKGRIVGQTRRRIECRIVGLDGLCGSLPPATVDSLVRRSHKPTRLG